MLDPTDIKTEPLDIKEELNPDSTTGNKPKKRGRPKLSAEAKLAKQSKITEHVQVVKKPKKKHDRFNGMPEEEVLARFLPDRLAPDLDIVIVGINPGLYAAYVGHHYAGPGNHFWKCMFLSGLIPKQMNAMQDEELLQYGIGFTNIVARTSRGSADLSKKEIKEGAKILTEKLLKYKPKIAVFNGKGIYEVFLGHKNFYFGKQPDPLEGTNTAVYVMPSSSARCSQLPRAVDKVPFYAALKKFRDHLIGKLPDLEDSEITFPDLELKTAKKEPKEEIKEEYPGENQGMEGDPALNQLLGGAFNVIPHSLPNTYQDTYSNNVSSQSLPQIKQEPGTCPPMPEQQQMVTVKQEPGVDPATSCPSQSNASFQSQGYYQGPGDFSQSNNNSFATNASSSSINGLNGLFARFSSQGNYGVVKQTSSSGEKPVQFNDALCDILTEGSSFEFSSDPVVDTNNTNTNTTNKKSKPRKRKSASSLDQSPMGQNSQSPLGQNSQSPMGQNSQSPMRHNSQSPMGQNSQSPMGQNSRSPMGQNSQSQSPTSHSVSQPEYATLSSAIPVCQPVPVYAHPSITQAYQMNHSSAIMGMPPNTQSHTGMPPFTQAQAGLPPFTQAHTGLPPFTHAQSGLPPFTHAQSGLPPFTHAQSGLPPFTQSQTSQPGMGYPHNPHVTQPSSFTQMMNINLPYQPSMNNQYNYMQQFPNMQGYPFQSQGSYNDPHGQYQGPSPPQAVTVKQEKPDH